jgi:hypothetical protein
MTGFRLSPQGRSQVQGRRQGDEAPYPSAQDRVIQHWSRLARCSSGPGTTQPPDAVPLWVKSAVWTVGRLLPVFPKKRTFSESFGMSQRCRVEV